MAFRTTSLTSHLIDAMTRPRFSRPLVRCLAVLLWLCAAAAMPVTYAAEVRDIRLWRAPDHTRLVFDLSAVVEYKLFILDAPERVVIDIADSSLATRLGDIEFKDSPITGLRSATRDGGLLRVVIDLNTRTLPKSFTLEPNAEHGHRLVVDLYDSSEERDEPALSQQDEPKRATNRVASDASAPSGERGDIVVAISAGHGGEDPGGIGYDGKLQEKHITLRIARALYDYLDRMPGYAPVMHSRWRLLCKAVA